MAVSQETGSGDGTAGARCFAPDASAGVAGVLAYHEATKHHPQRYARSLGRLDWATQPDPFRRFAGAELVPLAFDPKCDDTHGSSFTASSTPTDGHPSASPIQDEPSYDDLFASGAIAPRPVNRRTLSAFFECALAISAWKEYGGTRWALRCNPSSGNLHPTEGYLVIGPCAGIGERAGVYHYAPKEHGLERRCAFDWPVGGAGDTRVESGAFLVGLSSILWREAWKYGERAFRYCQHDVGHALAALTFSAARLGWQVRLLDSPGDADAARLLGLDRDGDFGDAEREEAELLAVVIAGDDLSDASPLLPALIAAAANGTWSGQAYHLSRDHVQWDAVDMAADATRKPATTQTSAGRAESESRKTALHTPRSPISAREVFLRRRSAVDFDGRTSIARDTFYRMVQRVVPGSNAPWTTIPWPASIHLFLFVHLVDGLPPGLYALMREPGALDRLKAATRPDFAWTAPEGCPVELPLYFLMKTDCRRAGAQLSLGQAIAGESAFSLGMIADFERSLRTHGAWFYRRLFWEAGMIGQVLYLEAEAAALREGTTLRATGIGAYFDDPVHDVFGFEGRAFQSLYHFTVGGAVEDHRLTTLPPYDDNVRARL